MLCTLLYAMYCTLCYALRVSLSEANTLLCIISMYTVLQCYCDFRQVLAHSNWVLLLWRFGLSLRNSTNGIRGAVPKKCRVKRWLITRKNSWPTVWRHRRASRCNADLWLVEPTHSCPPIGRAGGIKARRGTIGHLRSGFRRVCVCDCLVRTLV